MRRICIIILAFLFGNSAVFAEFVPIDVAKEYAYNFMVKKNNKAIGDAEISVFQGEDEIYTYIVNFEPEGWVIISADDKAPAIIAYSLNGRFDPIEVRKLPFYFMIDGYKMQIKSIIENDKLIKHATWNSLESTFKKQKAEVSPLINVEWNQGAGWNSLCPADVNGPGGHAYAGCVAVAMAQSMSVYRHPETGYGSKSYTEDNYGAQFVDFGQATYNWSAFENNTYNEDLALFLYHLGVSVSMNYGADASGAFSYSVPGALKTYFDYTNQVKLVKRSNYSDEEWIDLLNNELSEGRAIYYAGDDSNSGHAFNIDGVNAQGLFHLNWGWSGSYNGYYSLSSLAPGTSNYSSNQEAVINIMPRDHRPYDIELSNNSVKENLSISSEVGLLTALDETFDDTHTFQVSGPLDIFENPGSVPFVAEGNKLITTEVLDNDTRKSYEIIVEVTDKDGNTFEKTFLIFVLKEEVYTAIPTQEFNDFAIQKNGNTIYFSFNNGYNGGYDVGVVNISGKITEKKSFYKITGNTNNNINLEYNYSFGLYFIIFDFKNYRISKKIILD